MVMSGLVHGGRTFRYDRNTDKFEQYCVDKTGRSLKGKNINSICNYGDWIAMAIHEGN